MREKYQLFRKTKIRGKKRSIQVFNITLFLFQSSIFFLCALTHHHTFSNRRVCVRRSFTLITSTLWLRATCGRCCVAVGLLDGRIVGSGRGLP